MGTWRGLRVAFILGSLFMILLIIVYWDDVGGFNLYPLQEPKHKSPHPRTTAGPSHSTYTSRAQTSTSSAVPTTAPSTTLVLEETGGAAEAHTEEEGKEKQVQRKEETREDEEEKERGHNAEDDREQEARKQRIVDVCSGQDAVEFPGRTRAFEQIPNRELDHLIVDDTHQIIYCYVPKVACTNWKRVMVVLSQSLISPSSGKPYTDPEAVPPDLVHNSSLHLTFAKFWRHYGSLSRHLMALKLQHYTKFLFVRDPFVRLISAFRNKFGRCVSDRAGYTGPTRTSTSSLALSCCVVMLTCQAVCQRQRRRRLQRESSRHFSSLSHTCWMQRPRGRVSSTNTGGRCTVCAIHAR
ncbi:carbohydrate sulfotransferase 12-like isoform X4 [Anarhichas minor]|uniref:carbohydrate sulfotransferase 12-like isoform X4 n=1 Tax=Anarhichas minor TaxID=65739 RepID=UPI003F740127